MNTIDTLLVKHPIISDQISREELRIILTELESTLHASIRGDICEFGCYSGTTSLFIQRMLTGSERMFHVYDSFAGLPEKSTQDISPVGEQFKAGELLVSKATFVQNFKKAGLKLPTIHKGWFSRLQPSDVPEVIAFAFLDGDYYDSIRDSLKLIEDKLTPHATIVIDDYANEALPGAAKAVNEWLRNTSYSLRVQASLGIINT